MKTSLRAIALVLITAGWLTAASAVALRPEIARPLQQAAEYLKAGKGRDALNKVREAEQVSNRSAVEQQTIDRMKGAAAQRAGDNQTAVQAFEAVWNSGSMSGGEKAQIAESLAFAYSQLKSWGKTNEWINRAEQAGSRSPQLQQLQSYVQAQTGDYAAIGRDAAEAVAAAEKAGRRPGEDDLLRLADAQQRTGGNGYTQTLEKLLAHYPKKDYWNAYLGRLTRKSGFSDRFALDVMRLRLATSTMSRTEDFMEMAQLALQAGFPAEGRMIVERGFAAKALGVGEEGERHKRLRDLAVKREAEQKAGIAAQEAEAVEGDALVQVGYAYVTLGQVDQGIALIEKGIAKGGLRRPQDAKLRLGTAQLQSAKQKGKAAQTLRGLTGNDGAAEIGRLWTLIP